jgi:hypothetical protein
MSQDTVTAFARELPASLAVHPHRIDLVRDALLFVRLDAGTLHDASFLDERVVARDTAAAWLAWPQLVEAGLPGLAGSVAHYLVHVGHCGSTLVSRLLGELGLLQLREPQVLRTLAEVQSTLDAPESRWSTDTFASRLRLVAALFDRGAGQRLVKATSFCNDLVTPIFAALPARRLVVVYTGLRSYLANVLAGPNSQLDLRGSAPLRIRRLHARVGDAAGRLHGMTAGEISAMSWVAETTALAATLDALPEGRALCVEFDEFLADVRAGLRALNDHLTIGADDASVARAAGSSWLGRYSKAPEHAYDARLRRDVLRDAERRYPSEIRSGLDWCGRLAAAHPAVARAVERFDRR